MKRPIVKPSIRIKERAQRDLILSGNFSKLAEKFTRPDHWREIEIASEADRRVSILLRYIHAIKAEQLLLIMIDQRGERDVLIQLIRDLTSEITDESSTEEELSHGQMARRKAKLLERANEVCKPWLYRSERRLAGESMETAF